MASASRARQNLLKTAGLTFEIVVSNVAEDPLKKTMLTRGCGASEIAAALARAKALNVSAGWKNSIVIGADQTLSCEGRMFDKPRSREEARETLMFLSGRSHELNSSVAICQNQEIVWHYQSIPVLKMRPLSAGMIEAYLDVAGAGILSSVGCYRLEGVGSRLFETIDGDYFSILGLPLLPLLAGLRDIGAID